MNNSFESLSEYKANEDYKIVDESLLLEKDDDDGMFGNVIDRGVSFVPRAARFKKAKKEMKGELARYHKDSMIALKGYAKELSRQVNGNEKHYSNFLEQKVNPLVEDGKNEEAANLVTSQKKKFEKTRDAYDKGADKVVEDVLKEVTETMNNRIQKEGFVLGVEISPKGQGKLRSKWVSLAAVQTAKISTEKEKILTANKGYLKLNEMIAEMESFIQAKKHGNTNVDFGIQYVYILESGEYKAKVNLRMMAGRPKIKEKGIIIGNTPDLSLETPGATIKTVKGEYAYNVKAYDLTFTPKKDDLYVIAYAIFVQPEMVEYSDLRDLESATTKEHDKGGEERVGRSNQGQPNPKNTSPNAGPQRQAPKNTTAHPVRPLGDEEEDDVQED